MESSNDLSVQHENCASILQRIQHWLENHGANPAYDQVRSLIQDAGNVLHASIHEIEICMHDEVYFPRLDWLEDLRRDSAFFNAVYAATNGFRIPLGHQPECYARDSRPNINVCTCGVETLREELTKWRGQRFANAQPPNTLENKITTDIARCEDDHVIDDTPPWDDDEEDIRDTETARERLQEIEQSPDTLVHGEALEKRLGELDGEVSN